MKKLLLSTTALATAGVLAISAPSDAWAKGKAVKLKVGGFMAIGMGVGDDNTSFEKASDADLTNIHRGAFNIINDSEVVFRGSGTLNNGLTVSVQMQLEGDQATGSRIDESYMKISSKGMGDIRLGSTKLPGFVMAHGAPYVGPYRLDTPDLNNFIQKPTAVSGNATPGVLFPTRVSASDNMILAYISPPLGGGLRIGVGFTPSTTTTNARPAIGGTAGTETEVYDAIISWESKVGATSIKADVAYSESHGTVAYSDRLVRGGFNLGFGGTTIGGEIGARENLRSGNDNTATSKEGDAWAVAVKHKVGAYTIGVGVTSNEQKNSATEEDAYDAWNVGVATSIGPGVTLSGGVYHTDWDAAGDNADTSNNEGWAAIMGIKVAF